MATPSIDWTPHLDTIEEMLRGGKTRREIAAHLG